MGQPALLVVVVVLVAVVVVVPFALGLVIVRRNWPSEVMRRGYADSLLVVPAYVLPGGACWLALTRIAQLSWDDALWVTLALSCGVGLVGGVWYFTKSEARAGRVLIDLGEMRARGSLVSQAVFLPCILVGLPQAPATKLFCLPFGLLMGLWLLYCRDTHVQVRENGLWTYTILRDWDSIEHADWVRGGPRDGDVTLRLRLRHRSLLAPGKWCAVPMDGQLMPEVETALRAHGVMVKTAQPERG